ncbi:hypothetical protein OIU79_020035 [Salix purpurea]|uniref:Uncharacterized protein n=1 Tax=Salix purpurea TaxID=77065 RepID=A0A9Q0P2P3_SALPP|nr:hypothetical protein OIU79_020035 [Salix purpurea]
MKGPLNISQVEGIDDEEDFEMEPVALPCPPPAQQSGHSIRPGTTTQKKRTPSLTQQRGSPEVFFSMEDSYVAQIPGDWYLTIVSIILSSWVFAMYREDDLPQDSGLITAFSLILTVTVLVNLFSG